MIDLQDSYLTSQNYDNITLTKLDECYRITGEIIDNLDEKTLNQIMQGANNDVDSLLSIILNETFVSIFGKSKTDSLSDLGVNPNTASSHYVDNLSSSIERTLQIESLPYFITSVLPDFDLGWHHLEWAEIIRSYQYYCIEAARGHGKSHFFSMAYPIWKLFRYNKRSLRKELNHLGKEGNIFSATTRQVDRISEIIRDTVKDNSFLLEHLWDGADSFTARKIDCKNGAKIRFYSTGSSVRGGHPGWIIGDDLLDESALYSEDQRQKVISYFHSVMMNMIEPGGPVGVIGTPFHNKDLYGDLKTKKGWHVREYPSIFPDGKILWPERFSYTDLMLKRDTQGPMNFSRENLCRPIISDSSIFPIEILQRSTFRMNSYTMVKNSDSFPVRFIRKAVGCDFAISSKIGADSSVFIVGGIDEFDVIWIMNMFRMTGKSYAEQISLLKAININFSPDLFMFETNGFQKIFAEECRKENMPIIEHVTGTNKYDFKEGVPSLSVLFETGKIKIPIGDQYSKDQTDLIFNELSSMAYTDKGLQGVGGHDDIVIALWKLVFGLKYRTSGSNFDFSFI